MFKDYKIKAEKRNKVFRMAVLCFKQFLTNIFLNFLYLNIIYNRRKQKERKEKHMYYLENLAIEITRRCNMSCRHCLRGEAQNVDIDLSYILKFLEDVSGIGSITFTGGEPSLNVQAMEYTLEACKTREIPVASFYVVTNGKSNALQLVTSCIQWYAYCDEDEVCGLALSVDPFHEKISRENERILRSASFFCTDKFQPDFRFLIDEGRAKSMDGYRKISPGVRNEKLSFESDGESISVESMVYLSANGDIKTNCDISYDNMDYCIGNIRESSLDDIFRAQMENDEKASAE